MLSQITIAHICYVYYIVDTQDLVANKRKINIFNRLLIIFEALSCLKRLNCVLWIWQSEIRSMMVMREKRNLIQYKEL